MADDKPAAPPTPERDPARSQSATLTLVRRARLGDPSAGDRLFARLVQRVRRWAKGRLPERARDLNDTVDVVQDAAAGVWRNLDRIAIDTPGDLEAYLRRAVGNRIRDEARRVDRRPESLELDSQLPDDAPSPLDHAMTGERSEQFHAAFAQLTGDEREAILARHDYGYSYEEVAALLGKPSSGAARMAVHRAVAHLAELMRPPHG